MSKANIIKVCGMREEANIRRVELLGVDWMGFIFYRKSPRYVGDTLAYLPEKVKRVGVFVNEKMERMLALAKKNRLDMLQLHGDESPDDCKALQARGYQVVKAFGIATEEPFPSELIGQYENCCDFFLFDTRTPLHGGSGKKFSWEMLSEYQGKTPFLLSGGITPSDVEAIKTFSHPKCIGIDLNSGFETAPAVKDIELLRGFLEQIV